MGGERSDLKWGYVPKKTGEAWMIAKKERWRLFSKRGKQGNVEAKEREKKILTPYALRVKRGGGGGGRGLGVVLSKDFVNNVGWGRPYVFEWIDPTISHSPPPTLPLITSISSHLISSPLAIFQASPQPPIKQTLRNSKVFPLF